MRPRAAARARHGALLIFWREKTNVCGQVGESTWPIIARAATFALHNEGALCTNAACTGSFRTREGERDTRRDRKAGRAGERTKRERKAGEQFVVSPLPSRIPYSPKAMDASGGGEGRPLRPLHPLRTELAAVLGKLQGVCALVDKEGETWAEERYVALSLLSLSLSLSRSRSTLP